MKYFYLVLGLLLMASCDNSNDSSSPTNYTYNRTEVVSAVSQAYGQNQVAIYDTVSGDYRIIVTTSTIIWKERSSRSGSDLAAYSDVFPGDIIRFSYNDSDINYEQRPLVVSPPEIWAYWPDSTRPVSSSGVSVTDSTNHHDVVVVVD